MTIVGEGTDIEKDGLGTNRVLNFKGTSMTMPECEQLCKSIVNSDTLDSIRFSDCLLPEEITISIIDALSNCKSLKVADFKGNKFRDVGAEQLCKLLKQTTTLNELYLEWNNLGLNDASMESIAEGLALNESVEILDLSRNQISHSGGKLLSLALKQNKTLKSLDLRWNNIGVAGGRELLSALQENKSLVNLQLDGNNILSDTLNAISTTIQRNVYNHSLYQQHELMVQSLKDEIDRIENEKRLEVTTLEKKLEKEKEVNESTLCKLKELKSTFDQVSSENVSGETELKSAVEKITSLEENLSDLTKINSELRNTHLGEIKVLEESVSNERKKWEIEIGAKDSLISTLQKEIDIQINQNKKNEIEIDQKYQQEKEKINRECEDQMKSLSDKITKHLHDKGQFEEEITKLKTSIINNKLMFDEELGNQRSRLKEKNACNSKQYEEKITILLASKDELQLKVNKLLIQETETNAKLLAHQKDIENYKQVIMENQKINTELRSTHLEEIKILEERLNSKRKKWEVEIAAKDSLILALGKEKETQHNQLEKKQTEINNLQNLLKGKEESQIADEKKYRGEKERINAEYEEQVKSLTDKIMKHLHDKEQLEEEITKLKTSIMNNKIMFDEDLANQRSKWKEENAFNSKQYEEKIAALVATKDELQAKVNELMIQETETHAKLVAHQKDIDNYKQVIVQNQDIYSELRSTHLEEIKILEESVGHERKKWGIEIAAKESLIITLGKEKETQHNQLEKNETEINNLQNLLKMKEETIIAKEQKYQDEKERINREFKEQMKLLTDKSMKYLQDKEELEEEITKLQTSSMNNKMMFDEELGNQRSRWKEEHAFNSKQYEEKITVLVSTKDELQAKINELMIQESETHAKLVAHQKDIDNYKHFIVENKRVNTELQSTHLKEIKILEERFSNERKKWDVGIAEKDSLILTLEHEKEKQHNQLEKKQTEINNLENLLKAIEENQIADEQKYQDEKEKINRNHEELVKSLTEKITKHLHDKEELEEEITKLKTNVINNKLMFDEELANQRSRLNEENSYKTNQYEEKIDILVATKDELQSKINMLMIKESEAQAKLVSHQKDIERYQKDVESYKSVIVQNQEFNTELQNTHLEEMKVLEESVINEQNKWEIEITAKDKLISTLSKEKEIQQNQFVKNQTEITDLQNLLQLKEEKQIAEEQKYQGEKERINREYEEQVKLLTDKIMKHLHDKEQLEEDITKLKTSIMNNKMMFDEELANQRSKWKEEDALNSKQYGEKIDILVTSKDELQSKINMLMIKETETHAKLVAQQKDIDNFKQVIEENQNINSELRSTHLEEMKIIEERLNNKRKKWENEIAAKDSLILTLGKEKETQRNEIEKNHIEINNLHNLLKQNEANQVAEEQKYQGEKERINREYEEQVRSLTEKIMKLLHDKEQLEEEITKLKTSIMNNKIIFDEELGNQRSRWKEEDALNSKQFEEKIEVLVSSKDDLQSKINMMMIKETETHAKLVAHQKDIDNFKQVIEENQNINSELRSTHLEEMKIIEERLNNKRKKWEIEIAAKDSLILTLRKEKETQNDEVKKIHIEINNLHNLLKQNEANRNADEKKYHDEKEKINREYEEQVKSLTDKITKHFHDKERLEEEITKLKTKIMNNKIMFDEELANQRSRWKEEDALNSKQFEETIEVLVSSKDELQSKINVMMIKERENHAKINAHQRDIDNCKQVIEENKNINSELRNTHLEEIKIIEERLNSERKKWEIEIAAKDSLISTLRKEKETQNDEIEKINIEINNLNNLLKQNEENQIVEEQKYQGEKERINTEYEEQVKSLTDKIMKHLHDKEQLEEEITKLKTSIMNNKIMFDEELGNQRSRWKEEDALNSKQYEERIDILVALHLEEIKLLEENLINERNKWELEISAKESLILTLRKEKEIQHNEIEKLQIKIDNLQNLLKQNEENQIAEEKKYQGEKERINEEHEEQVKSLTDKIMKHLQAKEHLEEEIAKLNTNIMDNRVIFVEDLANQKSKWKEENALNSKQYEEKIDTLVASKDELQSKINILLIQKTETNAKLVTQEKDIETYQKDIENYKKIIMQTQEINSELRSTHLEEIKVLEESVSNERRKWEIEIAAKDNLRSSLGKEKEKVILQNQEINSELRNTHLEEIKVLEGSVLNERRKWEIEIAAKDSLIITLGKEKEMSHKQIERYQIDINNLQSLLKQNEENQITNEQKYQNDKERLNKEYEEQVKSLTDKIMKHLQDKKQLEEEITKLKTSIMSEKIIFDEELANERSKWKEEDALNSKQYEEKIDILIASKDELQSIINNLTSQETEKDDKLVSQQKEIERYIKEIEHCKTVILQNENINSELRNTHLEDVKELKESLLNERKKWDTKISAKNCRIITLENEKETQQNQSEKNQTEINNLHNLLKLKEESQVAVEQKYQDEKEMISREYEDQVRLLTDETMKHIYDKEKLEEEITKLKTSIMNNKSMFDEELETQRSRWKEEDNFKSKQYEEKIDILVVSKDQLLSKINMLIEKHQIDVNNLQNILKQKEENQNAVEQKHHDEKERINKEYEEQVKSLTDKVMKYLHDKEQLEEEIPKLKASIMNKKIMFDEELANQRSKWKEEEALNSKQYEERIDTLVAANDELQSKISSLMVQESETQAELISHQKDIERYQSLINRTVLR